MLHASYKKMYVRKRIATKLLTMNFYDQAMCFCALMQSKTSLIGSCDKFLRLLFSDKV